MLSSFSISGFQRSKMKRKQGSESFSDNMVKRWTPEDVRKLFDEPRHSEYDFKINRTLMCFLENEVTLRTKGIMNILLQNGADPMFKVPDGTTLAGKAFEQSDVEVVTMFLDHLKDINAPLCDCETRAIHIITEYQDESFLRIFLSYNPDLDIKDIRGLTALHMAVLNRNFPKTRILVDAGANVDIADEDGSTPIHCILADEEGDESITFFLLEVANIILRDKLGETPLHLIMKSFRPYVLKILQILLDKGADPWEPNDFGNTPLSYILQTIWLLPTCYILEILKEIFHRGTFIKETDPVGNSILHMIAMVDRRIPGGYKQFHDFKILLLEYGADPNQVNERNETVIDIYKNRESSQGLYLIKYLVLKSFEDKFQFGPQLLTSIESHKTYAELFNICKGVLSDFECSSFHSTKPFTLLDVLTATSTHVLVRYVKNREFRETMVNFDFDILPVYGQDLKKKFVLGFERYEAEIKAIQYLLGGGLTNLECMEGIVKFLPIEELRRIVSS